LDVTAAKSVTSTNAEGFGISFSNILTGNPSLETTYALGSTTAATIVYTTSASNNDVHYFAISGELKITEVSNSNIKGTFNAVCQNQLDENDTINLTAGAFNAAVTSK